MGHDVGEEHVTELAIERSAPISTDACGDLLAMGVIDPAKVVRTALRNAASVARLMLTTECLVVQRSADNRGDDDSASMRDD